MSVNYAAGLSNFPHIHKGKLGLPELFDSPDVLEKGIKQMAQLIKDSKYLVVHTGAGISTAAGIPDFRGPTGVWTLESQGLAPHTNIDFDDAIPTKTHMAIFALQQCGIIKYVVSQNIDGLHLRSGYPRSHMSELHGNIFVEKCEKCFHEYYRRMPVGSMMQQRTGNVCTQNGKRGITNCRGKLRDTVLDWEDNLPLRDLNEAESESRKADLSVCLGTTLQIVPSGKIPLLTLKNNGKLVIVNLQKTKYDKKAQLLVRYYVDDVMEGVMKELGIAIPTFYPDLYYSITTSFPIDNAKKEEDKSDVDDDEEVKDIKCESQLGNSETKMIKCESQLGNSETQMIKCEDKHDISETSDMKGENKIDTCEIQTSIPDALPHLKEDTVEKVDSKHVIPTKDNSSVKLELDDKLPNGVCGDSNRKHHSEDSEEQVESKKSKTEILS